MWEGRGGRGDGRQGKECGFFDVAHCCRRPPHASVARHVADDDAAAEMAMQQEIARNSCSTPPPLKRVCVTLNTGCEPVVNEFYKSFYTLQ